MDDYERVTELQQISERSAGATSAQAATYLEGMEAAVNKIRVAWEKLVTTLTDSDAIINIFNLIGGTLDVLGDALGDPASQYAIYAAILVSVAGLVKQKVKEAQLNKQILLYMQLQNKEREQARINELKNLQQQKELTELESKELQILEAKNNKKATGSKLSKIGGVANKIGTAIGIGVAVYSGVRMLGGFIKSAIEANNETNKLINRMNELSNAAYEANQKFYDIKDAIDTFTELDNKLIKTKEDLEEIDTTLTNIAEKLSPEEQEQYNLLQSNQERIAFLNKAAANAEKTATDSRNEILSNYLNADAATQQELANNAGYRDAIFTSLKQQMLAELDALKLDSDLQQSANDVIVQLANSLDFATADALLKKGNITDIVKQLVSAGEIDTSEGKANALNILSSDDYGVIDKVKAFKEIESAVGKSSEAAQTLQTAYNDIYELSLKLDDSMLEWIDNIGLSTSELNDLYSAWSKLQKAGINITQEEYEDIFMNGFLPDLANGLSTQQAILTNFGNYLDQFGQGTEKWINAYNILINELSDAIGMNVLDMSQSMDSFNNWISAVYDNASNWNSMSESDKADFVQSHSELFGGEEGAALLQAFNSGNYTAIQQALMSNSTLEEQRKRQLDQVNRTLELEMQKMGDNRNEAYIQMLQVYKQQLEDISNLYAVSLEVQLEMQNNQLEEYKSYLEDQKSALEDSLNERKEAYQNYFDEVNQTAEDEEYEEQAALLSGNIAKLASSTNGAAIASMKDLQNQLDELQKDRIQTLRERAQDAIVENIDNTISDINDKFDELLDNERMLLSILGNELENPNQFIGKLIQNALDNGMSELSLRNYIQGLQTDFGSAVSGVDWGNITTNTSNDNTSIVVNIDGQTFTSRDKQNNNSFYNAIQYILGISGKNIF